MAPFIPGSKRHPPHGHALAHTPPHACMYHIFRYVLTSARTRKYADFCTHPHTCSHACTRLHTHLLPLDTLLIWEHDDWSGLTVSPSLWKGNLALWKRRRPWVSSSAVGTRPSAQLGPWRKTPPRPPASDRARKPLGRTYGPEPGRSYSRIQAVSTTDHVKKQQEALFTTGFKGGYLHRCKVSLEG